jgi:hypothetical protein
MSIHTITLELPFGFVPDPILETATPEQRAIVLTTGCEALKALLNKTSSLSNEEAYKKATAEESAKWSTEKSRLEEAAKQEKKELFDQKSAEVKQLNDTITAEQKKVKHKDEELTETKTLLDLAEKKADTLRKSQDKTVIEERDRTRAKVEEEKSKEIEKLNKEIEEKRVKIENTEKALSEEKDRATKAAVQAEKDKSAAVDKVREELNKKIEEQQERVLSLTGRQSNSSIKGKDNENDFAQLLHDAFGLSPDYLKYEPRIESGDHVIQWEGLKLMFENKKYKKTVPKTEVEKAIKDFKKHPECDVLIFVSETSSIAKHERPGHLDIDTVDGRAAIWIGEFDSNENKVVYMQMIAQVIRQLARLQKRAKELGNGDDIVGDYKNKISIIRRYLQNTKEDLDSLVKAQNEYQRAQKSAWDALKERIRTFKDNFNRRLESATKDDDDDDGDSSAAIENKNVPGKKREAAAMKKPPRKRTHKQVDSTMNSTVMNTNPQ